MSAALAAQLLYPKTNYHAALLENASVNLEERDGQGQAQTRSIHFGLQDDPFGSEKEESFNIKLN